MTVCQAKIVVEKGRFRGVRGATFRLACQSQSYRRRSQGSPIEYGKKDDDKDNLYIDLCFLGDASRHKFIKDVFKLHDNPHLVEHGHKPTIKYEIPTLSMLTQELLVMTERDFKDLTPPGSTDFDYPVQNLSDLKSGSGTSAGARRKRSWSSSASGISVRSSERLGLSLEKRMLFTWQSFETSDERKPFQCCHIIPAAKNPLSLKDNPDNFVGGSYDFHNGFDSLNTNPPGVPRFVLEYVSTESEVIHAEDGQRSKVRVRLVFRDPEELEMWTEPFRTSFKRDTIFRENGTIEAFLHVKSPDDFKLNVEYKKGLTESAWRRSGFESSGLEGGGGGR